MKKILCIGLVILLSCLLFLTVSHRARAQDASATSVPGPTEVVDQIMAQIGQGRIDGAVGMMDGLKNQADLKQEARGNLLNLRDQQGQYHGYDITTVQRLTPQLQIINALAYYDNQPVLLRFHFYRPQSNSKWAILALRINTEVPEIDEILKDTPVDYLGSKARRP